MNQQLHLNWSLSFHIQNKNFEEAEMVLGQMSNEEIVDSHKSVTKFLSSKKLQNEFRKRYKFSKNKNQLTAIQFLNKKVEMLQSKIPS